MDSLRGFGSVQFLSDGDKRVRELAESLELADHLVELHKDFLSHQEVLGFFFEGVLDVHKVVLDECSANLYRQLASCYGLEDYVGDCCS